MSGLRLYREKVAGLASKRTGEPFYNGSPDHAAVIIEQLFRSARSSVSVLSDDLDARVYGRADVIHEASLFLQHANHRLRVLVEEETFVPGHPLLAVMRDEPNAEMRRLRSEDREFVTYNFALADADSYRYEPKKTQREAIAAFGDPRGAENLVKTYNAIWARSVFIDKVTLAHHTAAPAGLY